METVRRWADKVDVWTDSWVTGSGGPSTSPTTKPQKRLHPRQRGHFDSTRQSRHERRNSFNNESTSSDHHTTQPEHQVLGVTVAQRTTDELTETYGANVRAETSARTRQPEMDKIVGRSLPPLPASSIALSRKDQHKSESSSHPVTTNTNSVRQHPKGDQQSADTIVAAEVRSSRGTRHTSTTLHSAHKGQSSGQKLGYGARDALHYHQPSQAVASKKGLWMPGLSRAVQRSKHGESEHSDTTSESPVHTRTRVSQERWSVGLRKGTGRAVIRDRDISPDHVSTMTKPHANDSHGRAAQVDSMDTLHRGQKTAVPVSTVHHSSDFTQARPLYDTHRAASAIVADSCGLSGRENEGVDSAGKLDADNNLVASGADDDGIVSHEPARADQNSGLHDMLGTHENDSVKIRELETQLIELLQEYDEMKLCWEGAVDALARLRQESTSTLDDVSLKAEYAGITFAVQHWVMTYCTMPTPSRPDKRTKTYLRKVTSSWKTYMEKMDSRNLLLQSFLLNWLSSEVLTHERHGGLWWAGSRQEGLSILMSQLEPAKGDQIPELLERQDLQSSRVREYAAWKARTAHLVARSVKLKDVEEHIDAVLAGLVKQMAFFVPFEQLKKAWDDLRSIIRSTIKLDEELCKSRAFFTLHGWDNSIEGQEFNEATMQPAPGSAAPKPGMKVDLVLVPALSKTGSADGDMFETSFFISKWVVICSERSEPVSHATARPGPLSTWI